jgi:succinyl-diaminopimelate desuccinylase
MAGNNARPVLAGRTAIDPVELARTLIRCQSVTPAEAGALDALERALRPLGFSCRRLRFGGGADGSAVDNLYARFGDGRPNFCFAGHIDVVPPGARELWTEDPFAAVVRDGRLWGRGAADMKAAVACFVAAAAGFLTDRADGLPGAISLLITADEEGPAINGTAKVLAELARRGERLDACLVGEPTNPAVLGEMIKIGRRGSLNAELVVTGVQGHAAYPDLADNPIPRLLRMLRAIDGEPLDAGTPHFQPSAVTITSIDVGNPAPNVIPAKASARFNIRFNDLHTGASLRQRIEDACTAVGGAYTLRTECSGNAFVSQPGRLSDLVTAAVRRVTGRQPELSTSGGTSDARFIKDHCPVVEFGMPGETAHKVDESVALSDITALTDIYRGILHGFFERRVGCQV